MAFQTATSIEISAPPATVFAWLTERDKLSRWVEGNLDMMPADTSQLHTGYKGESTFQGPDGSTGRLEYEMTAYEPPYRISYRQTQAGATTLADYQLREAGAGTLVEASTSTDWDVEQMSAFQQAEAQVANLPSFARDMVRQQLEQAEQQMESANPAVDAQMKKMFDEGLAKLKDAVESGG
jgi:uncharacterized protein YndB with AHSA1/START domain